MGLGLRHDYLVDVRFSSTFLWLLLARSVKDPFEGLPIVAALDAKLARLQDLDPALHKRQAPPRAPAPARRHAAAEAGAAGSLTWLLEEEGALEMLGATVFAISEDCPAPPPAPPAGGGAQDAMVIADSDDEGAEGAEVGGRAEDKGQEGGQDPPAASQCSPGAGAGAGTKAQGGVREVELVKGGAQKQVTSANVREYVDAYATYKLVGSVRGQMLAFRKGLAEAVGADALGLFLEDEAELLVAGLPEIDAREWRRHARYSGASLDAPLSAASQLAEWCGPAHGARATGRAQASAEAAGRRAGSGRSWRRLTRASARSSSSSLPVRARARQQPRARAAEAGARGACRVDAGAAERVRTPPWARVGVLLHALLRRRRRRAPPHRLHLLQPPQGARLRPLLVQPPFRCKVTERRAPVLLSVSDRRCGVGLV